MICKSNYYPQIMLQKYEINSNNHIYYHKKHKIGQKSFVNQHLQSFCVKKKTILLLAHKEPLLRAVGCKYNSNTLSDCIHRVTISLRMAYRYNRSHGIYGALDISRGPIFVIYRSIFG